MLNRTLDSSTYTNTQARVVSAQFASRPDLRAVVANLLIDFITTNAAALDTDILQIDIASPNTSGGHDTTLLVDVALSYLANGTVPDFSLTVGDRKCHLTTRRGVRVRYLTTDGNRPALEPEMALIRRALVSLPDIVHICFQQALTDYWNASADTGTSRWQWLGDQLRNLMRSSAIRQPNLDDQQRALLTQVVEQGDSEERSITTPTAQTVHTYCIETTITRGAFSATLLSPSIVIVRGGQVLLCSSSGVIEPFASLDAFGTAWAEKIANGLDVDTVVWKRYEPAGNIFDIQAALLLSQQLEDLETIKLPAQLSKNQLLQRYTDLTDITPLFCGAARSAPQSQSLRLIQAALPEWLRGAEVVDQLAYREHTLELARLKQATKGQRWSDGIDGIRAFAARSLQQQMLKDHPLSRAYHPDQLQLTFHVAIGNLGSGYIQRVNMTLTELSIKNLAGQPGGRMTVHHLGEDAIPEWMTSAYLLNIVTVVNIGQHYPQLISDLLLSDSADAQQRQQRFARELQVSLPMKALEHSIRHECGLTRQGYQSVRAVLRPAYADRMVNGHEIVIRPLAFSRSQNANADTVDNMFVIEPRNTQIGPHLLYRPLYSASLYEYPTREELLAAIARPGQLQQSVLAWLSNRARPIYDNGGFKEPHIRHFSHIDVYGAPDKPAAATLAVGDATSELMQSLQNGTLMQDLFGSEARAIVNLGQRESVSNAQSRWAILLEGGWTLFNTLLALPIGGPLMVAGWMVSMTASLIDDTAHLDSPDPLAREAAWVDFLMNLAMLLLHGAHRRESPATQLPAEGLATSRLALDELRQLPTRTADSYKRSSAKSGIVGLPAEPPGGGETLIDFDKSRARDSTATRLLERLRNVRVDWPEETPEPITTGLFKGLYKIGFQRHASVAGLFFQVNIVPGFAEVYIIHPQKPEHPGIKLRTDGRGHWSIDQGLKLTGGGPKNRISAKQEENRRKLEDIRAEKNPVYLRQLDELSAFQLLTTQCDAVSAVYVQQVKKLELIWKLLDRADARQLSTLRDRHAAESQKASHLWPEVTSKLRALQEKANSLEGIRRSLIETTRKEEQFDRTDTPALHRTKLYAAIASTQLVVQNYVVVISGHYLQASTLGEPLDILARRVETTLNAGDPLPYRSYIGALEHNYRFEEPMREWTHRFETTINELHTDSPQSAREAEKLLKASNSSNLLNSLNVKLHDLDLLRELSVDRSIQEPLSFEDFYASQKPLERLKDAFTSHIILRTTQGFSPDERHAVLDSIVEQYQMAENASLRLNELGPMFTRPYYQERFIENIRAARLSAEADLAQIILEREDLTVANPQAKPSRARSSTRRVFTTRNLRTLIGDALPTSGSDEGEVIEIRDSADQQTISRYHKHAQENEYVLIDEYTPPPAVVARSAKTIIEAGKKLLSEGKKLEALIDREMAMMLRDPVLREEKNPADWDTMLTQRASDMENLAKELQKTTQASTQKTAMLENLASAAQAQRQKGGEYRIAGYKLQSPTAQKVDYLWTHHAIDIEPISLRKATQSSDFLTEFVIKDKHTRNPLWYAHFHYTHSDARPEAYAAGHLKTIEQRSMGFKTQLSQARDNREINRIWRSRVSVQMARKLFFYE